MDILLEVYNKRISSSQAYEMIDKIRDDIDDGVYGNLLKMNRIDFASILGMDEYEYTYCQGAPLSIISQWRYCGWPCKCCKTNLPIDYKQYHWFVQELNNGGLWINKDLAIDFIEGVLDLLRP